MKKTDLNKKAQKAGTSLVMRGGKPPQDDVLESKYQGNQKAIMFFKKGYYKHYTTDKEQSIRKAKHDAKECVWGGRNLPSDEHLKKKYNEKEIKAYKKTFFEYYKTAETQAIRKNKHATAQKKYCVKKKKNSSLDSHKDLFIQKFMEQAQKEIEQQILLNAQPKSPAYIDDINPQINIIHPEPLVSQEYIPSPYDVLKTRSTNGLFFTYLTETEHKSTCPLTQEQPDIDDYAWISDVFTM